MQQIYRIGCNWTTKGKLYLHQEHNNSHNVNTNKPKVHTLSNIQMPTQTIATILSKKQAL